MKEEIIFRQSLVSHQKYNPSFVWSRMATKHGEISGKRDYFLI